MANRHHQVRIVKEINRGRTITFQKFGEANIGGKKTARGYQRIPEMVARAIVLNINNLPLEAKGILITCFKSGGGITVKRKPNSKDVYPGETTRQIGTTQWSRFISVDRDIYEVNAETKTLMGHISYEEHSEVDEAFKKFNEQKRYFENNVM